MPFGQRRFAINIYNIRKGHFWSRGGGGGGREHLKQTEIHQFHLPNDKCHNFRCIAYAQMKYGKVLQMKSTPILNILALLLF